MIRYYFNSFLDEIMLELDEQSINSEKTNKKINIFTNFISNECCNYKLNNGSPLTNFSNLFMVQCHHSDMNNIYDKQTEEIKNNMRRNGSRTIYKNINVNYNTHDYYDGIINNEISLLVDFFNENQSLFNILKIKIDEVY